MKILLRTGLLLLTALAWLVHQNAYAQSPGSSFLGTRWNLPGPKTATISPPTVGGTFGPGAADWSIVNPNIATLMPPDGDHPAGTMTLDFDGLLPPANMVRPDALFELALNIWQAGSLGSWSKLAMANDGGGVIGNNVAGSNEGDIRAAVLRWTDPVPPSSQVNFDVIAHGFSPDTLGNMLYAGTIGGDVHIRPHKYGPNGIQGDLDDESNGVVWVDDPMAPFGTVDLLTVMIHEVGHALGLGHNVKDMASVMQPVYAGPKRSLSGTDMRNIRQLYGLAVPEPASATLLMLTFALAISTRRI